jgi:hypothetical protein
LLLGDAVNWRIAQRIDELALLCAVAIALGGAAGCGGKSLQDDGGVGAGGASLGGRGAGGSGGSVGVGGSGGMSGTTGGAGSDGFQPPGCLRDLFAPCSIAGSCVYQTDDAGNPPSFCYASGARSTSTGSRCTTNGPSVETATITKPDGTLCYTVSISASPSQACEYETYRWSDASGATVATGTNGYSSGVSIRCEVSGETAMRGIMPPDLIFTSGQCSPGNCP